METKTTSPFYLNKIFGFFGILIPKCISKKIAFFTTLTIFYLLLQNVQLADKIPKKMVDALKMLASHKRQTVRVIWMRISIVTDKCFVSRVKTIKFWSSCISCIQSTWHDGQFKM